MRSLADKANSLPVLLRNGMPMLISLDHSATVIYATFWQHRSSACAAFIQHLIADNKHSYKLNDNECIHIQLEMNNCHFRLLLGAAM